MRFPIQHLAVIALAGVLAACEHKIPDWPDDGYTTLSTPMAHPVLFAPQASSLSATERARLVEFVRGAGLTPGSSVTVAAGGPKAAARQQAVAAAGAQRRALQRLPGQRSVRRRHGAGGGGRAGRCCGRSAA